MAELDDLDELLDSTLDDFRKVEGTNFNQRSSEKVCSPLDISMASTSGGSTSSFGRGQEVTVGQGLGLGLPSLSQGKKKSGPTKGIGSINSGGSSATQVGGSGVDSGAATTNVHLSETLEKLAAQTRQTLEGFDTGIDEDGLGDKLVENLVKQFEELGGSQDMQSMMDLMMRQLLSKEVLHEPMKEISERYPQWLEANKLKLSTNDFSRYSRQYDLIKQLCEVYETSPNDFQKIVDLMQNMQECGQPPTDIVQELAPGLELGEDGLPMLSDLLREGEPGFGQNCSIM